MLEVLGEKQWGHGRRQMQVHGADCVLCVPLRLTATAARTHNACSTPVHLGGSVVPCPATGVLITVGFTAPITSIAYPGETAPGANTATFYVETLESNPSEFAVALDTAGVAVGTNLVTYVEYSDNEGNSPDMSRLTTSLASTLECDADNRTSSSGVLEAAATTAGVSRELQIAPVYTCDVCFDLLLDQRDVLAMYDTGGKRIVCDPTCVDNVSDHTDCNCKFPTCRARMCMYVIMIDLLIALAEAYRP